MRILLRLACVTGATLGLSACAPMLAMVGSNTALVQVVAQIERVKLAADGASFLKSDKTLSDHALSKVTGKDCKVFNILTKESVCSDKTPVIAADSDTLPKEVATGEAPAVPNPQEPTEAAIAAEPVSPVNAQADAPTAVSHAQSIAAPERQIGVSNNASGD